MVSNSNMVFPGARIVPGGGIMYAAGSQRRVTGVGDLVEWDSTTGGMWTRKEGTVVEVVPAGCRPQEMRSTVIRDQESYVVRCAGGQTWWPISVRFR